MSLHDKIKTVDELVGILDRHRDLGRSIVFTNGCFDLLHPGHVRYLEEARAQGDLLVVAVNSDASVRALKGSGRPILSESHRLQVLAGLESVDFVTVFDGPTPLETIERLRPTVLVKGGDWATSAIVGNEFVEANGGHVVSLSFVDGLSTTTIIERIRGRADNPIRETGTFQPDPGGTSGESPTD